MRSVVAVMAWGMAIFVLGCQAEAPQSSSPVSEPSASAGLDQSESNAEAPERLAVKHLPNAVRIHAKVISGGLPAGDAAFAELKSLGVKTIISVDGAKPDVETARKFGLRYVHLPHGYDGIARQRQLELAKAVQELEGPIYIHCHHGKHRSPAAASVACIGAGLIPAAQGLQVLEVAGTSRSYRGLFAAAEKARRYDRGLLRSTSVEFHETLPIPPMAEAMVALEHTYDRVKQVANANWKSPAGHPDVEPAHEVLLLREHFTEMLRTQEVQSKSEAFQQMLRDSERLSSSMEQVLSNSPVIDSETDRIAHLNGTLERINDACKSCHQQFRDVPLEE